MAGGAVGTAPAPTVTAKVTGLNDVLGGGYEPPDVSVAAGPGFLLEAVNLAARVWRTGAGQPQVAQTLPLGALFHAGSDRLTDPRVLYDAPSGRWFASISDIDRGGLLVAVSRSADPTGAWDVHALGAGGCADQPRLGVSDAVVAVAADVFSSCTDSFSPLLGGELWVLSKQQLVEGAATVASTTYGPDRSLSTLTPVQSLSSTSTQYVVSVDSPASRFVHLIAVDGAPPGAVRVQAIGTPEISPLQQPPNGLQPQADTPGPQPVIQTNDDRILDAVWENGKLWFTANTGCVPAGDTTLRSCGRLVELSTDTRSVDWDTDLSQPGSSVFFPALRPDASGNLVIVYGESSRTVQPELVALVRSPDGTFSAPTTIAQSVGPYLGNRYGDYFGAARDPSNPSVVWVAGEAGWTGAADEGWSTDLASITAGPAPASLPAVARVPPPRLRAQAVVSHAGAATRLVYRSLDDASGVRETITVSTSKATVYRATTAPGTLHAGQLYYVLWRPARTLRGRLAFCVQSLDAGGDRSARSCATVTLR